MLQLAEEPPPQAGQELRVWPRGARESRTVRPAHVEPLLRLWVQQGQVTTPTSAAEKSYVQLKIEGPDRGRFSTMERNKTALNPWSHN